MKRQLTRSILIIISCMMTLLITESFIEKTMESIRTGTIGKINAVMSNSIDPEMTIWGASTAWGNIDPKIIMDSLDISVMNMGINGTNIDQFYGLTNKFLSYTKNSKCVIIVTDVRYSLTQRDRFYHIHNWVHHFDDETIRSNMMEIDENLTLKSKYLPFYRLTLYDNHAFKYFRQGLLSNKEEFYFPKYGFENDETADRETNYNSSVEVKIDDRVIDKIKKVGSLAAEKNIKPILVMTPCQVRGINRIKNYSDVLDALNQLDFIFLDYSNSEISNNPTLFKDNVHLNEEGAEVFTAQLASDLKMILDN